MIPNRHDLEAALASTGRSQWPLVMGILNVTPDSFSDGGRHNELGSAIDHAARMVEEGADIIDVGGESTRPGSDEVSEEQELHRVIPVIEALSQRFPQVISVDTSKSGVMTEAVKAGAGMINDVYGLRRPGALEAASQAQIPVCLMHMLGEPKTMQQQPEYQDVLFEVREFLAGRAQACMDRGIKKNHIIIDPGFGFGKALDHNLSLLKRLKELTALGYPVLVGISRKSMLQQITGLAVDRRVYASVAAAVMAAQAGAAIIRVHDVAATVQALQVVNAVKAAEHLK